MKKVPPHAASESTFVKKPKVVKLPTFTKKAVDAIGAKIEGSKFTVNEKPPVFLHPWSISVAWLKQGTSVNEKLELDAYEPEGDKDADLDGYAWYLQVMPGFVNGTPPRMSVKAINASQNSKDRVLRERQKVAEESGGGAKLPEDEEIIDVPLTEYPYYELDPKMARTIGFGSVPVGSADGINFDYEPIPEAFKMMGVLEANEKRQVTGAGIKFLQTLKDPELAKKIRLLRAVDVVLKIERASLKFEITKGNPFIDGYSELVTPKYARLAKTRRYASVMVTSGPFTPPPELELEQLDLMGPADPEYDYLKLATVYFISPFDTDPEKPINKYWQPEVKYDVFWNVGHMPAEIPPIMNPEPVRIFLVPSPGFAVAAALINGLLAPINNMVSRLMAALRAKRLKGVFWTT